MEQPIEKGDLIYFKYIPEPHHKDSLTTFKVYQCIDTIQINMQDRILIEDDRGINRPFFAYRFGKLIEDE